jgi:hypothetical protein
MKFAKTLSTTLAALVPLFIGAACNDSLGTRGQLVTCTADAGGNLNCEPASGEPGPGQCQDVDDDGDGTAHDDRGDDHDSDGVRNCDDRDDDDDGVDDSADSDDDNDGVSDSHDCDEMDGQDDDNDGMHDGDTEDDDESDGDDHGGGSGSNG